VCLHLLPGSDITTSRASRSLTGSYRAVWFVRRPAMSQYAMKISQGAAIHMPESGFISAFLPL
jgi:hypothetical protein